MAHRTPGPEKNRFAYAESPAKQRRDRDVPGTAHNPNELGRICILLAGVSRRLHASVPAECCVRRHPPHSASCCHPAPPAYRSCRRPPIRTCACAEGGRDFHMGYMGHEFPYFFVASSPKFHQMAGGGAGRFESRDWAICGNS